MARREIIAIIIMIVFGFSIMISIPIFLITLGFSPYIYVDHQEYQDFIFNSSTVIDLKLEIDVGNVDIKYTYDPVDYHARVFLNIEMIGQNIPSKNYTDYFNIGWDKTNSSCSLVMNLISNSGFNDSIWKEKDIYIVVSLNPVILFNINTTINNDGNVDLRVPGGIDINNIDVTIDTGNILLYLDLCYINGNMTGNTGTGKINFYLNNVQYTRNCVWNLKTNNDDIRPDIADIQIDIAQYNPIGFNVTGTAHTLLGDIIVVYYDENPEVGAIFTFYLAGNTPTGTYNGFDQNYEIDAGKWWLSRFIYDSDDYPAIGNYNISLYRLQDGDYFMNLQNV
jgi:hypothetical protein